MEGVLGETWVDEFGDDASNLNLKREDQEGVEDPVTMELLPTSRDKWNGNAYLDHQLLREKQ